jgi:tRNA-binding protein
MSAGGGGGAPPATIDDFLKLDVRVGVVIAAEAFPEARKPAFKLTIDFGPELGLRRSSAQITRNYGIGELVGRQVLAVVNLPPRRIAGFVSEALTLGVPDAEGEVLLIAPDRPAPLGGRLY